MNREKQSPLRWQSKTILLVVVPWTAASTLLQAHWWWQQVPVVAYTALGISGILGLIVWRLRAATLGGAATGALITASLMFSTTQYPYKTSWLHGGLMPLLAVFLLTYAATKIGKSKKEQLGTGEGRRGRTAAQVAANLGVAALAALIGPILLEQSSPNVGRSGLGALLALAALAEAAADTVSSEIGQVFGGEPRLLITLRRVARGSDGGVTLLGTLAGALAALIVAGAGSSGMFVDRSWQGRCMLAGMAAIAGVFGLLFDSLLGATLERRGLLNNDAVNFLSTLSAPVFSIAVIYTLSSMPPL